MTPLLRHLRGNLVAYLALFVALGGTGYAALRLPAGSVGNRTVKNHALTPIKFDRSKIAGYVADWAAISADGRILGSRPRAHVTGWVDSSQATFNGGFVSWRRSIPRSCFALATRTSFAPNASPVTAEIYSGNEKNSLVGVKLLLSSTPTSVNVAVICPQP